MDTVKPVVTVATLVTNNNKPTLSGTVSDASPSSGIASAWVTVNGQTLTAIVSGNDLERTVPVSLADGTYDVQATATDTAGNTATDATTNELTVDTESRSVTVATLMTNNNKPTLAER